MSGFSFYITLQIIIPNVVILPTTRYNNEDV